MLSLKKSYGECAPVLFVLDKNKKGFSAKLLLVSPILIDWLWCMWAERDEAQVFG